jgi:subtilisin family serine protease
LYLALLCFVLCSDPDLNVVTAGGYTAWGDGTGSGTGDASFDDGNGHGTHVAGTIGAIKGNGIGVVGVAPGAQVIPVKVLSASGSGSTSGVIAGVNHVGKFGKVGDVANMSLGGSKSKALNDAVQRAAGKGIKFTVAAGNSAADAKNYSPASASGVNVYTISAMNSSDTFASFSNYGSPVDYCAPGVSIKSTWIGGGYKTISGTSMAAPHAAGVLLLAGDNPVNTCGVVKSDPDGIPDPIICV